MTFKERYKYNPVTDLLGKGGFARVYKAKDINLDIEVAVKIFNATEADAGKYTVYEEIKKGIKWNHPNVIRYFDAAVLENINSVGEKEVIQVGIMELANAGDLKQFARRNPGSPALINLLKEVLSGLDYLHQRGIIHRDLKPQNILLAEHDGILTAKITDFGISKALDSGGTSSSKAIGTIEYMAPEQFNPQKYGIDGEISTNLDLWSFGVMVYELIANEPLYGQRGGNTSAEQIMSSILSPEVPEGINRLPEPYRSIIKKCLVQNATHRVKRASELIAMFEGVTAVPEHVSMHDDNEGEVTRVFEIPKEIKQPKPSKPTPQPKVTPAAANKAAEPKKKSKVVWAVILVAIILIGAVGAFLLPQLRTVDPEEVYTNASGAIDAGDYPRAIKEMGKIMPDINKYDTSFTKKASALLAKAYLKKGDSALAVPHLEKAAALNEGNSLFELGWMYYRGKFKPKDNAKSITYFTKAAAQKHVQAEVQLGNMYFMGDGVEVNHNEAVRHYFSAASMGNSIAMYALGLAYSEGAGVVKDEAEAKKWFQKVVDKNDNPEAKQAALSQLNPQ